MSFFMSADAHKLHEMAHTSKTPTRGTVLLRLLRNSDANRIVVHFGSVVEALKFMNPVDKCTIDGKPVVAAHIAYGVSSS